MSKNSRKIKISLFYIMIISLAIAIIPLSKQSFEIRKSVDVDFYKTNNFEKYIMNTLRYPIESVSEKNMSTRENRIQLNSVKNMRFIAINNKTDYVYSRNTSKRDLESFQTNVGGYVKTRYNTKSGILNIEINGKELKTKGNFINRYVDFSDENIDVYGVFTKYPHYNDELSTLYQSNEFLLNSTNKFVELSIVSAIIFVISLILYKRIKINIFKENSKLLKCYSDLCIEFKIALIIIPLLLDSSMVIYFNINSFNWVSDLNYTNIFIGLILKIIYILMTYLLFINYKNTNNKLDILKNNIYSSFNYYMDGKFRLRLKQKIVILLIVIVVSNFLIYSMFIFGFIGIRLLIIASFFTLFITGIYILYKLIYLDNIMESVEFIKEGNLDHKIDVKGNGYFANLAQNINNISDGLDNAIDEKLKSERMKSELITNVSHDLKTPLTAIINYVGLIKKEESIQPEYLNDYINVLNNKSKRLKVLIDDLFEASKASSGNIQLDIEKLDLNQLLRQSIGENEDKLASSNLDIRLSIPTEPVYINCDGKRMYRVFENLLTNIAKYSLENTRVYISIKEEDDKVYVYMKNISAYELDFDANEIIERFRRGDLSRNTEGSGLGLSIARDLVELQGGKFNINIDGDLFKVELIWQI